MKSLGVTILITCVFPVAVVASTALSDRVTASADRVGALELRLTSRLDRGEGADVGAAGQRTDQRLNMSQVIAGIATLVAVISLVLYAIKK